MKAEQEDEQRRHKRPAANAGHPDQCADEKPGKRVERIIGGKNASPLSRRPTKKVRQVSPWPNRPLNSTSGLGNMDSAEKLPRSA
jgi:hypothetical protein